MISVRCMAFLKANAGGTRSKGRHALNISIVALLVLSTAFGLAEFSFVYVSRNYTV